VLEHIFNAAILNRSEAYRREIVAKSQTFVAPAALDRARAILRDEHSCVISGPPGVGKTTLADMLTLDYLEQGFELFVVSEDVREAEQVLLGDRRQLFVYDDFLGRTELTEKLGKNEDNRIVAFMRAVKALPQHRFILTTREYILRAARLQYARFDEYDLDALNCILEIGDYSRFERALILYQHLYFESDATAEELKEFVESKVYREIVSHRNYTPRHIADALAQINRRMKKGGIT
jgi:DNA polymerase III delta prime subunit